MFKIKTSNAKLWRDLVTAISTVIDEGAFSITPEGISLRAMDPSHVAMVDFSLSKQAFDEYQCDKPLKMGISLTGMLKFLRGIGTNEVLELSFDEGIGKLNVQAKGKYTRTFSMSTLELVSEEAPSPKKFTFNARVKILSSNLRQALSDAVMVSDYVRLEAATDKFVVKTSGDIASVTAEFVRGSSDVLLDLAIQQDSSATFSLGYLNDIVKTASVTSEVVTLEFSSDMPLKLDFEMPQDSYLRFYLAPRIEAE